MPVLLGVEKWQGGGLRSGCKEVEDSSKERISNHEL